MDFETLVAQVPDLLPTVGRQQPLVLARLERVSRALRSEIRAQRAWRGAIYGPGNIPMTQQFASSSAPKTGRQSADGKKSAPGKKKGSEKGEDEGEGEEHAAAAPPPPPPLERLEPEDEDAKRALILDGLSDVFAETARQRVELIDELRRLVDHSAAVWGKTHAAAASSHKSSGEKKEENQDDNDNDNDNDNDSDASDRSGSSGSDDDDDDDDDDSPTVIPFGQTAPPGQTGFGVARGRSKRGRKMRGAAPPFGGGFGAGVGGSGSGSDSDSQGDSGGEGSAGGDSERVQAGARWAAIVGMLNPHTEEEIQRIEAILDSGIVDLYDYHAALTPNTGFGFNQNLATSILSSTVPQAHSSAFAAAFAQGSVALVRFLIEHERSAHSRRLRKLRSRGPAFGASFLGGGYVAGGLPNLAQDIASCLCPLFHFLPDPRTESETAEPDDTDNESHETRRFALDLLRLAFHMPNPSSLLVQLVAAAARTANVNAMQFLLFGSLEVPVSVAKALRDDNGSSVEWARVLDTDKEETEVAVFWELLKSKIIGGESDDGQRIQNQGFGSFGGGAVVPVSAIENLYALTLNSGDNSAAWQNNGFGFGGGFGVLSQQTPRQQRKLQRLRARQARARAGTLKDRKQSRRARSNDAERVFGLLQERGIPVRFAELTSMITHPRVPDAFIIEVLERHVGTLKQTQEASTEQMQQTKMQQNLQGRQQLRNGQTGGMFGGTFGQQNNKLSLATAGSLLDMAVSAKRSSVVRVLLSKGFRPDSDSQYAVFDLATAKRAMNISTSSGLEDDSDNEESPAASDDEKASSDDDESGSNESTGNKFSFGGGGLFGKPSVFGGGGGNAFGGGSAFGGTPPGVGTKRVPLPLNFPRPLELAIWNLDAPTVRVLLSAGADVNAKFQRNPVFAANNGGVDVSDAESIPKEFRQYDKIPAPRGVEALMKYVNDAIDLAEKIELQKQSDGDDKKDSGEKKDGDADKADRDSTSQSGSSPFGAPAAGSLFGASATGPLSVSGPLKFENFYGVFGSQAAKRSWLNRDPNNVPPGSGFAFGGGGFAQQASTRNSSFSADRLHDQFAAVSEVVAEFVSSKESAPASEGIDLRSAALKGDLAKVEKLLSGKSGEHLLQPDSFGNTPLLLAARGGHADVCRALLENAKENGVDVAEVLEAKNQDELTPLLYSVANPQANVEERWTEFEIRNYFQTSAQVMGMQVNFNSGFGFGGQQMGHDSKLKSRWWGPGPAPCKDLDRVCDVVSVLLEYGASLLAKDALGNNALMLAVASSCAGKNGFDDSESQQNSNQNVIGGTGFGGGSLFGTAGGTGFASTGPQLTASGSIPKDDTESKVDIRVVECLLKVAKERSVQLELCSAVSDVSGTSPVLEATRAGSPELLSLLLDAGADPFFCGGARERCWEIGAGPPLLVASRLLPKSHPVFKTLLEIHAARQNDEEAQHALEARDSMGTVLKHVIRYAGLPTFAGGQILDQNFGGFGGGGGALIDVDADEYGDLLSQELAVEFAVRLIDDCGASVKDCARLALSSYAPRAVISSIMKAPDFDSSELFALKMNPNIPLDANSPLEHFSTALAQVHQVLNNMHQQRAGNGGFGVGAGSNQAINANFQTDWFGKSKRFKSPRAALSAVHKEFTEFMMQILDTVSFALRDDGKFEPILLYVARIAASNGVAPLLEAFIDRVEAENSNGKEAVTKFVNARFGESGKTPIFFAGSAEVVKVLAKNGLDLSMTATDPAGQPPAAALSEAQGLGGAMPGMFGVRGNVPQSSSHCDPARSKAEAVVALLDIGGERAWDTNKLGEQQGSSLFSNPVSTGDLESVRGLVQAGAHPAHGPRRVDANGNTLLHLAVQNLQNGDASRRILQYLLFDCQPSAQLSPTMQNYHGQTPVDIVTSMQQQNPQMAAQVLKLFRRSISRLRSQLGREGDEERMELHEFMDAKMGEEADMFLRQGVHYLQSNIHGGFGFGVNTMALAPKPWGLGAIDGTDEASQTATEALEVLREEGERAVVDLVDQAEEEERDLKRRYERAQRKTLALRAVAFQEKLEMFDRGELPIDEKTKALFDEDNNATAKEQEPQSGSIFAAARAAGTAAGKAEADDDNEEIDVKLPPSARVLQIHAFFRVWLENGLPKNRFSQFVKLQPPGLPDLWQSVQNNIDYSSNNRGKMTAVQLYDLLTKQQTPTNNQSFSFGNQTQNILGTLDHADAAAYVLAIIRANLDYCTQS